MIFRISLKKRSQCRVKNSNQQYNFSNKLQDRTTQEFIEHHYVNSNKIN